MLSDFDFSPLSFDIPLLPPPPPLEDPPTPLDFDAVLDIAREFEFAHTITHVWPYDEEPGTYTELDDMFAAIAPAENAESRPSPSGSPITVNPLETDAHRSASLDPASVRVSADPPLLHSNDDQDRSGTGCSITLQGWSPPNGSQFIELDDAFLSPRSTMFLAASPALHVGGTDQPFAANSAADDIDFKSVPTPMQPAVLEQVRAHFATRTNINVPSRTSPTSHTTKPRPSSTLHPSRTTTVNYARAPRGGVPPHIARSVTKANILRAEKERKVMQDTFSSMSANEAKKPSVLRRTVKVERETSKLANGRDSGKKSFEGDGKERRSAKRVRV